MRKWLARILGKTPADEASMALKREVQSMRIELEERERTVANLREELERQRSRASAHVTESVQAQMEQLMADVATPVAQLLTQAHLLEREGKPVQAADVLAVAKRLVRTLEDNGLALEGSVGEIVAYDPDRHEPLSIDAALKPGERVTLRFVGLAYRGVLLRKSGVEKAEK